MARIPADKPHARIYRHWMDYPSWRTMNPVARALIAELLAAYRPNEPNRFELSDRTVAAAMLCGRSTAAKALRDLEERGWLEVVHVGRMRGPKARRASAYALATQPRLPGERPSMAFEHWRPQRRGLKPSTALVEAANGSFQRHR